MMSLTNDDKQWIESQLAKLAESMSTLATKEAVSDLAASLSKLATMESLRDVETALLTEFHKWSSPVESRLRTHASAMRTLDLQIEALADRVKTLEEKI